jgi:GNAT superfamily N-acetyltransferase
MTLVLKTEIGTDVSEETKSALADIVIALQTPEDYMQSTREEVLAELTDFCNRPGSFLITGYIEDELISSTFVLNASYSRSVKNNGVLKAVLEQEGVTDTNLVYLPAMIYVKSEHRGNGHGFATEAKSREVALSNGYTHCMRMVYKTADIISFYDHNYPLSETIKQLKVNDFMGKDIILETLV